MKTAKKLLSLALGLIAVICLTLTVVTGASADSVPTLSIGYANLSFRDSVCIKYAVRAENVSGHTDNIRLLIWSEPCDEYVLGTESKSLSSVAVQMIGGKEHLIFDYTDLTARQMTDTVYSRACVEIDGEVYYSEINKYSILQYAYSKIGKTGEASKDERLVDLLNGMLNYGALAQEYFGYKPNELATDEFYQVKVVDGILADGTTHGLYKSGATLTITAPEIKENRTKEFMYWSDGDGNVIASDATAEITVGSSNSVYTAVYKVVCPDGIHKSVPIPAVPATCTEGGFTEGEHCSVCGEVTVEPQPTQPLGHSGDIEFGYGPTCTQTGLTDGEICAVCGEITVAQQVIPALGHREVVDHGYAATCTENGLTDGKHCAVCKNITVPQNTIAALGHSEGDWITDREASDSQSGHRYKPCKVCGAVVREETIPSVIGSDRIYKITYELDGGINADENPDSYTYYDKDLTLFVPGKKGYAFAGWVGSELDGTVEKVTVKAGSTGDRAYTATWKKVEYESDPGDPLSPEEIAALKNSNSGIAVNSNGTPLSKPYTNEPRGNGVFMLQTAYTGITVDGIMDNAYTYGLHFELDLPQNKAAYENVDTNYDVYMVMGQDGKVHVYVKVHDLDIVINDEQWAAHWWHCDVWQMYIDYGSDKLRHDAVWSFAAEGTKKYLQNNPENWIVVMTEDGFAVEFEFDNNGKPFTYGDTFGFSFFYNDTWDYVSTTKYGRSNTRTGSALEPASGKYVGPDPSTQDTVMITSYPLDYTIPPISDEDRPEKSGDMLMDIASGAAKVCIIYGTNSSAHTEITAENLASALDSLGVWVNVCREDRLSELYSADYMIYLNCTGDAENLAMINGFHYAEYGVETLKDKIVSVGWQANANTGAADIIEAIIGYVVNGGDTSLVGTYTEELYGIPGENVPKVDGAQWITDSGDGAYVVHKLDTSATDYESYKKLLEAAGYKLHVENVVATVKNATYYTDDTVINVLYSTADKDLRVSIEPMYNTALPKLEPDKYTPTCESSVTLLSPNNLTMIVKLDNGEFIVIDSGNRHTHTYIYNELMKQHTGGGPIVIAAWIFTHFHQDHQGGFIDYTLNNNYMANTVIKSIILNFPEKQVLDTASPSDQVNLGIWPQCIQICRDRGATLYQARTGQKYYFGNAEVEILGTYDDLMPFFVRTDNTNHTNIIFSIKLAGQKIMVTGDATTPEFNVCAKRFGDYLKSDVLQVSHHGGGDGSNDITFYSLVDAPVVLVPGGAVSTAQKWAADNAKEVYYRTDGTKTLKLPYYVSE